jgi:hypothetical protein
MTIAYALLGSLACGLAVVGGTLAVLARRLPEFDL